MTAPAAVRERPILFSGPMVRAILDGSKTQTRRVAMHTVCGVRLARLSFDPAPDVAACPHGQRGDRLWVREAFRDRIESSELWDEDDNVQPSTYRHIRFEATPRVGMRYRSPGDVIDRVTYLHETTPVESDALWAGMRRRPSIHMPRWASRIMLELTQVRVERVQAISEEDAKAEGIPCAQQATCTVAREHFHDLWDSLNWKRGYGWSANPWVWVLSFRRIEQQAVAA